jgi:hypothetical protein
MSRRKTRTRHTIGRPRVGGLRLPALQQVLQNPETVWQKLTLDCYGEGGRTLEMCTGTALWYRYGSDPLPLRWVLTRDPEGKRPRHPPSFPPTPLQRQNRSSGTRISRWSLEVTFEEGRAFLGIETQRQWSDLATLRSTPLLFGLYSLVTLFGQALHPSGQIPVARVGLVSQAHRHLL